MLKVQLQELSPCERRTDVGDGSKRCPNWNTCQTGQACAKFQHYLNHGNDQELNIISDTPSAKRYDECYSEEDHPWGVKKQ